MFFILILTGCNGGSGANPGSNTLGGHITLNLVNAPSGTITGLQLQDGVDTEPVTLPAQMSGSVPFTFPTALLPGTAYQVTVVGNPAGLSCTPTANASGTMGTAPVTNIAVTCTDSAFTVSGTVHLNLVNALESDVELQVSDGSESITVPLPAGATIATLPAFSFPTALKTGTHYSVTATSPADLTCTVSKASGTIGAADVNDVLVTCSDNGFELSGQVTVSLNVPYTSNAATVVLAAGPDNVATTTVSLGVGLSGSMSFTFPHLMAQGAPYAVTIASNPDGNPTGLTCTPANNTGTIANANVTNISVTCADTAYALGGTINGLQFGGSVELTDNAESILVGSGPVGSSFVFPTALAYNSTYQVSIEAQSLVQCSLSNATGAVLGPVADTLNCELPQLALLAGGQGSPNPIVDPHALIVSSAQGVAVDRAANIYVSDLYENKIYKITPAGLVILFAGSGNRGSTDGTGAAASFYYPEGLAVDAAGNVYVADSLNYEIRKITPAGVVSTLAGSTTFGSADGTGAAAGFNRPRAVALDTAGNVYVADEGNGKVRKVTPTGVVTTLGGSEISTATGVAVDAAGNVYVVGTDEVRKITPAGVVTTLAGSPTPGAADGTGAAASFNDPFGAAVDGAGNVYVADTGNNEIRKITPAGVVTTLAGSTTAGAADGIGSAARFNLPFALTIDSTGRLYVADSLNNEIRGISPAGTVTTLAGSRNGHGQADGLGSSATFYNQQGVAVDGAGNVYVADHFNNAIRKITPAGMVTTLAGSSSGVAGSVDGKGSQAQFFNPQGVAVNAAGTVYVADTDNNEIRQITPAGVVTTLAGTTDSDEGSADGTGAAANFNSPSGIAVDAAGTLYVADTANSEIRKVTPAGVVTTFAGSGSGNADGTGSAARFNNPLGVAVDAAGNVYVADTGNNEIRKITPAGVVTTLAGSPTAGAADGAGAAASFNFPEGVAVDAAGNVYVADSFNNEIRKITPAGVVTTIVGNTSNPSFIPGPLPGALGTPLGLAVSMPDAQGNWNLLISTTSPAGGLDTSGAVAEVPFANAEFH